MKYCPKCGETKKHSSFYTNIKRGDGLSSWCKECMRKVYTPKRGRTRTKEMIKADAVKGLKYCYLCKKTKAYTEFNLMKKSKDGRNHTCKDCSRLKQKERTRNGKSTEAHRRWVKKHPDKSSAVKRAYEAKKRKGFVEVVNVLILGERDNWTCQLCFEPVDSTLGGVKSMSRSIDHIKPISLGGEHSYANTQLAHFGCNSRKNNKYHAVE